MCACVCVCVCVCVVCVCMCVTSPNPIYFHRISPTSNLPAGVVLDLLVDAYKLRGKNIQGKAAALLEVFEKNYNFAHVLALFVSPKKT